MCCDALKQPSDCPLKCYYVVVVYIVRKELMKILRDVAGPTGLLWLCHSAKNKVFAAEINFVL